MKTQPCLFIVFGGTGDLMQRKLLPAIFNLRSGGSLADDFVILGVSRREWDDDRYRQWACDASRESGIKSESVEPWCKKCVYYQSSGDNAPENYQKIAARAAALEKEHHLPGNRVFYLATPPGVFGDAIQQLGEAKLQESSGWTRLVVEKPFGRDLASARQLNQLVGRYFDESQIYRIDHYLGKETVQNLAIFRFANMLFESAWNRHHIASVQITVAEDMGIGTRAGYYEGAGALRDMVQPHLTQLVTLIAMDAPPQFNADAVRDEKLRVLRAVQPIRREHAVFGQYNAGALKGRRVLAYHDEAGVRADSTTETYVAVKLLIDNWRWQGVPFYLRTGKRLPEKVTEIAIIFREPPVCLFEPLGKCAVHPNILRIRLQPDESFGLSFDVKVPGESLNLQQQALTFRYRDAFDNLPDAYQTLILEVVRGDQTDFVRADETENAWRLFAPLLENKTKPCPYAAGTWGPREADEMLKSDGAQWQDPS